MVNSAGEELHCRCYGALREKYLEYTPCLNTVVGDLGDCNKGMVLHVQLITTLKTRTEQMIHIRW